MNQYAEIILNTDAVEIDKPFTYKVPESLIDRIKVGQLVKVPFGFRGKQVEGIVINLLQQEEVVGNFKIKDIGSIETLEPIVEDFNLKLMNFLREKYLCKYIDALRLFIPSGIMQGLKKKTKFVLVYNGDQDNLIKKDENYREILEIVKINSGKYSKAEFINKFSASQYRLNKLIEAGLVLREEEVVFRYNVKEYKKDNHKNLTSEQQEVLNSINLSNNHLFLLKGVTGSGKTEVYMRLVEETLKNNKSAIILVPEIALTPQMIERFKGRFGPNVALFHSKLSLGERYDEWYRVKSGKAKLVVGARSAIFLPVVNLGLIIIDEEHENTYKSEQNPKYQTREVAEFICKEKNAKLILGSATPTIETYYRAISGEIELLEMNERVDNKPMPTMEIVDMREELKVGNRSLFSRALYDEIGIKLKNREQIVLFLNRRGFSTFVSCRSCGYVFKCHNCDISLTYHKSGSLVCHYCGAIKRQPTTCPKCQSKYVKYFGAGTERVEEEVKKYFPQARVLRMDVDTTRAKDSHEKIYNTFKQHGGDILIGTQMISKGLDFPNVTLVGVLAADMSINIPDYRASERTFQLITQVGGRAGRGHKEGKVLIQTYTPDHYSINFAANYDYENFYNKEFGLRAMMNYPPFSEILLINGSSVDEEKLKNFMNIVYNNIRTYLGEDSGLELLGPIPCILSKIKENYRWQLLVKGNFSLEIAKGIKNVIYELNKNNYNEIRISIDINPNNLL